jgi:hypothetical protein
MYGIKYRIAYYRKSENITTIDILEKNHADYSPITDLKAYGDVPLEIISDGDPTDIYTPTIGSGATIKVVGMPLDLIELYTEDPQKYMVKIYHGVSGSSLIWQGFISPEIFTGDYSSPLSSVVTLQCNDGMQVLGYIKYEQIDRTHFTGNVTIASIFTNILAKLGITFINIKTLHDLQVAADITDLFNHLFLSNENFVDESGVAMDCRKVLEGIVGGLSLVMYFEGDNIYLVDPITLQNPSKGRTYLVSTFGSETSESIGEVLDISNKDITWGKTGSQIDIVPAITQTSVKYDPYTYTNYTYDFSDKGNWSTIGTWESRSGYYCNPGVRFEGWTFPSENHEYCAGVKELIGDTPEYVIALHNTGNEENIGDAFFSYTIPRSNITQDAMLMLKISMDVFIQTKVNSLNIYSDATSTDIYQFLLPVIIKVGNYYFKGDGGWFTGKTGDYLAQPLIVRQVGISNIVFAADNSKSKINDVWTTASLLIPLNQDMYPANPSINGDIYIEIMDNFTVHSVYVGFPSNQILPSAHYSNVLVVMLKNFKVEFIDRSTGLVIENTGVNRKAIFTTELLGKDVLEIPTICGTGPYGSSRGAFKTDEQTIPNINISGLYIGDAIDSGTAYPYNTADIILLNYMAQYKQPRNKLTVCLDASTYNLDIRRKLIKDSNHFPTQMFYVTKVTYDDHEETNTIEMVELTSSISTSITWE